MIRFGGGASAAVLLLSATPLAAQRSGHRVLDRAAIAAAGWHRMGDIAAALPAGSTASIDGFNHELRGSRLGFFQTTQVTATWLVRLDGQPMPMRIGGTWILDEIPVAITQLDSVVVDEGPRLTDGRATLLGTIDLYTRRPMRASLAGDYQHGDETGDPGPYRYTARNTPNIEKLGPFASGAVAAASSAASIDLAARYSSLNITDQRIIDRVGPTFGTYQSDVNASGGSGVATLDALGGRAYVVAGRGRFTGFLPLATATGDQQARVIATHGGVSGSLGAVHRTWRYVASGTELEVASLGGAPLLVAAERRRFADAFVEGDIVSGVRAGIGTTLGRQEIAAESRQQQSARAWASQFGANEAIDASVERSAGTLRFSGVARVDRAVGDSDRIEVSVTRLEAWRFGESAWMDQSGYDSSGTTASQARVELATRAILGARPTWYARAFAFSGVGTTPVKGLAAGVTATTTSNERITGRVRGEITQLLDEAGTGESSTPAGYFEGDLSARAAGGFRFSLAGRYAPGTHWSGAVDDVPVTRRIDFSVNKGMWHDRVRAQLVMRNLLNVEERTHPDGAQWNLRTHLAVTVVLPAGADR
jgi:hypothetical protein